MLLLITKHSRPQSRVPFGQRHGTAVALAKRNTALGRRIINNNINYYN